jgi:hypothetical protein
MAKSHTLSTAAKPADLEKAYNSAVKALGLIGMKMVTKKPDAAKIAPFMIKGNSKAEFLLSHDGKLAKLTVECDSLVNTLGIFDVEKERNEEKRLAILENLMTAGLISKADYEKELKEAKAAAGPDPKVVANLRREIEAAEKKYEKCAAPTSYDAMVKLPELEAALRAAAKAQYMSENFEFLDAVEKRMKPNDLITQFILPNSRKQINIDSSLVTEITMDPKKISLAVAEIKQLIQTNIRKPALKILADERDKVVEPLEKKLKDLGVTKG